VRWQLPVLCLLLPTVAFAVPSKHVLIGKVVKVTDGDTITVLTVDNEQDRIRLYGIDAPEQKGAQPFWRASRDQLASMVAGKTVTVTWDKKDRNGRILGWVSVDQGIWVNKVMVLTGCAWWFERYAPDEDQLREVQEVANEAKRGLWSEPMTVAPWDWRNGVRKL
jgi:micrococcal nuclease